MVSNVSRLHHHHYRQHLYSQTLTIYIYYLLAQCLLPNDIITLYFILYMLKIDIELL